MSASIGERVVPWITRKEFVEVYRKLFSESLTSQQEALDHISLWQSRCEANVPLAVTSSADLIAAQLEHRLHGNSSTSHSKDSRLRHGYTLALIRFVNFMTDRYQKDGNNVAIPLHRIGQEIGIPEWIVSLRHEGTHRALPTLEVLTRGCDWALSWLKEGFWERQLPSPDEFQGERSQSSPRSRPTGSTRKPKSYKKIQFQLGEKGFPVISSSSVEEEGVIARLLVAFQQIRFQELAGRKFRIEDLETGREGQQVVEEIKKYLAVQCDECVEVMIQAGYLRPSVDQLSHMGLNPHKSSLGKLGWVLVIFWRPLLREINHLRLTSCLIERLVSIVTKEESHWNKMTHAWIQILVPPYLISFPSGKSTCLFQHQVSLSELPLLQTCLQHPNSFTQEVLTAFSSRTNSLLTPAMVSKLSEVIQVYLSTPAGEGRKSLDTHRSEASGDAAEPFHSVQDVLSNVSSIKPKKRPTASQWRECPGGTSWQQVPIGLLPWQDVDQLYNDLHLGLSGHGQRSTLEDGEQLSGESEPMEVTIERRQLDEDSGMDSAAQRGTWSQQQIHMMRNKITVL